MNNELQEKHNILRNLQEDFRKKWLDEKDKDLKDLYEVIHKAITQKQVEICKTN